VVGIRLGAMVEWPHAECQEAKCYEPGAFMPQVIRSPKVYDVCIIGSGAAGGTAAKVLTEGGLSVVMLEAGPPAAS
jgi:NADPH-dependent 2,4-dienoyl-CoA reductase/sulfur reductase-like enzyme